MDKPNFKLKRIKKFEKEFLQQSSCPDKECQWTKDRCFHGTEDVMKDFICASMELAYEKAYQDAAKRFRMREQELQDSFRRKVEDLVEKVNYDTQKDILNSDRQYHEQIDINRSLGDLTNEVLAKLKNIK